MEKYWICLNCETANGQTSHICEVCEHERDTFLEKQMKKASEETPSYLIRKTESSPNENHSSIKEDLEMKLRDENEKPEMLKRYDIVSSIITTKFVKFVEEDYDDEGFFEKVVHERETRIASETKNHRYGTLNAIERETAIQYMGFDEETLKMYFSLHYIAGGVDELKEIVSVSYNDFMDGSVVVTKAINKNKIYRELMEKLK